MTVFCGMTLCGLGERYQCCRLSLLQCCSKNFDVDRFMNLILIQSLKFWIYYK